MNKTEFVIFRTHKIHFFLLKESMRRLSDEMHIQAKNRKGNARSNSSGDHEKEVGNMQDQAQICKKKKVNRT